MTDAAGGGGAAEPRRQCGAGAPLHGSRASTRACAPFRQQPACLPPQAAFPWRPAGAPRSGQLSEAAAGGGE